MKRELTIRCLIGMCLLVIGSTSAATPIYVEANGSIGRGLAALRGAECMVVLPAHVAGQSRQVAVYGRSGAAGDAAYVKDIGKKGDDLMLFKVTSNAEAICDDTEVAMFKAMPGAVILRREKNGALGIEQVSVTRHSQLNLIFVFLRENAREAKGISGSVIFVDGRPRGMVIDVGTVPGRPNIARQLEYVAALEGSWVLGQAADVSNIRDALAVLQTAADMRTKGDIGQVAAIEGLVRSGSALSGVDLRGVGMAGVALNNGDLSLAQMQGANLENSFLQSTRISQARFDFASLKGIQAQSAGANETRFYYAIVDGADFSGANASQSNWAAASARSVNFRGADLSGASFFMTDLTGADFTNANLKQTSFIGAILTDAVFTGAELDRTDFTAATGEIAAFSEVQRAHMCATLVNDTVRLGLIRTAPSARFSSGTAYDDLVSTRVWLRVSIDLLPRCQNRDLLVAGLPAFEVSEYDPSRVEKVTNDFMIDYESEPYDKIGLRRTFAQRAYDQIQRIENAQEAGNFLRLEHAGAKKLSSALAARVNAVKFEGKFSLNYFASAELVGLKYHPSSMVFNDRWTSKAKIHLMEETRKKSQFTSLPAVSKWPKFFPEGTKQQELTDAHVELFRKWTLNRARAVPSRAFLQFRMPSSAIGMIHNAQISMKMQPEKRLTIKPFIDLGNPPGNRRLPEGAADPERLFIPTSNTNQVIFVLAQPHEAYAIEANAESLALLRNNPQLELEMEVVGAEIIDKNPEVMGDHYILIKIAPIRLVAIASDGATLGFEL